MNTITSSARVRSLTVLLVGALCVVGSGPAAGLAAVPAGDALASAESGSGSLTAMDGSGTAQDPYEISNATGLQAMQDDPDAHYVLVDDVDASDTSTWNSGAGFEPVGSEGDPFGGTFDGQNYTIDGLTVDRGGETRIGLFGKVSSDGVIQHVRLTSVSMRGSREVGGLAGRSLGTVRGVVVGGEVAAAEFNAGGVVGRSTEAGTISHSSSTATVDGGTFVGGLVGNTEGTVHSSSATGDVSGEEQVGGLVGTSRGTIRNTYATGAVSGDVSVGGLVGEMDEGTLSTSFTTASVSGETETHAGSVVGKNRGSVTDVYWNGETSGVEDAVGRTRGSTNGVSELTTAEMTGTAAATNMDALDTSTFWSPTDEYPVLQSQVDAVSLSMPDQVIVDRPATATATVALTDGRSIAVTETADYSTNHSHLSVDAGTVSTSGTGPAEVTATVADHSDSAAVSVVTPPDVSVDSSELRYDRVGSETAAPVDVTLVNDGGADGEFDVLLAINGTVEATRTVTVPGHSTQTVQFNWSAPATGTYSVAVNDTDLGDLTVVDEPETSVASATMSETTVELGDATTVEGTLENAGDAAAGHTVELTADGETVATKDAVVPADGATVSFEYTADSAGEYDLAVDGTSAGTLTAAEMGSVSVESVDAPDSAGAGEDYEVTATLANSGGLPITTEVTYSVGGSSVGTESVEVPADGTTVTFEATAPEDGESVEHAVTAGDDEWTGSSTVDAAMQESTATDESGSDTGGDSAGDGDSDEESSGDDGSAETTSGDGAGFGVVAVLCALLVGALLGRRSD